MVPRPPGAGQRASVIHARRLPRSPQPPRDRRRGDARRHSRDKRQQTSRELGRRHMSQNLNHRRIFPSKGSGASNDSTQRSPNKANSRRATPRRRPVRVPGAGEPRPGPRGGPASQAVARPRQAGATTRGTRGTPDPARRSCVRSPLKVYPVCPGPRRSAQATGRMPGDRGRRGSP